MSKQPRLEILEESHRAICDGCSDRKASEAGEVEDRCAEAYDVRRDNCRTVLIDGTEHVVCPPCLVERYEAAVRP